VGTLLASSRDRGWVVAGALWALVFCFKQNTGLFGMGAVICFLALDDRSETRPSIARGLVVGLALLAGGGLVLRAGASTPGAAAAVGVALLPLAVAVVRARPGPAFTRRAAGIVAGFGLLAAPLLLGLVLVTGLTPVLQSVLHVGSGAAATYTQPYPSIADVVGSLAGTTASIRGARQAFEALWFLVFPLAVTVAACGLAWRGSAASSAWRLVVCAGVLFQLQILPRADFWHLAHVAGPLLLLTVVLTANLLHGIRVAPRLLTAGLWLLVLVRFLPTGSVVLACLRPPPAADAPVLARADLRWDLVTDETIRAVPDVTRVLAGVRTMVGFPALSGLGFLASAVSPLPHDYFFPGLLDARERDALALLLASAPPDAVVILRGEHAFSAEAVRDYAEFVRDLEKAHPVSQRLGPFEVRRRRAP
jgi:hypothetical protein